MAHSLLIGVSRSTGTGPEPLKGRSVLHDGFANDEIVRVQIGVVLGVGHGGLESLRQHAGGLAGNEL